jgi:exosortase B
MGAVNTEPPVRMPLQTWWPVVVGLLALYVPTYTALIQTFWSTGRGGEGPVILAAIAWLLWRERQALSMRDGRGSWWAIALFVLGLMSYALGRSQSVLQLEVASQVPVLLGLGGLLLETKGLRRVAFPVVFSLFLIPVPGTLLDELLLPLKQMVSALADASLHAAGYPIARNGVMLTIGPYDLLIADACSGLNSMVALTGIGLIYTYAVRGRAVWRNITLLAGVPPIAFASNVIRVLLLLLVTYYCGDSAGRAVHSSAAYLEIALAFAALFAIDRLTGWIEGARLRARAPFARHV